MILLISLAAVVPVVAHAQGGQIKPKAKPATLVAQKPAETPVQMIKSPMIKPMTRPVTLAAQKPAETPAELIKPQTLIKPQSLIKPQARPAGLLAVDLAEKPAAKSAMAVLVSLKPRAKPANLTEVALKQGARKRVTQQAEPEQTAAGQASQDSLAAETLAAETLAPVEAKQVKRGLFAFLFGQGKAEKAGDQAPARQEVKARVQLATSNRPKGRLWCVPFARMVSGLDIRGNAKTWWKAAQAKYDRGHTPKVGAVMSFAASRAMPLGHVAVVSKVVSKREVLLDHANWDRNRITVDQLAVDVSAANDWSQVRVANHAGSLGRINPVNGFIYN